MNRKYYAGIDPGTGGALAIYSPAPKPVDSDLLWVYDMPLQDSGSPSNQYHKKKSHKAIDTQALAQIFRMHEEFIGKISLVLLEQPHSLPSDGHVGAFYFGKACGHIEGALGVLGYTVIPTMPAVWKSALNLSSVKKASILLAKKKFGHINSALDYFTKVKHHDRAEAALLAWFAADRFGSLKSVP